MERVVGRPLVEFWSRLQNTVHPDDAEFLKCERHSFNLDFPPPAFIGDVNNARVLLLNANGGYDDEITPAEFNDEEATKRFVDLLRVPQPMVGPEISPYYTASGYADLLRSGDLALINAVAYRSRRISQEPENKHAAKGLPSAIFHRNWLRKVLLPAAALGEILVIAHRFTLWGLRSSENLPGVLFSRNSASPHLSKIVRAEIDEFLQT